MERAGISFKSKLFSSNPWAKEGCSRTDSFPCKPGGWGGGEGEIFRCANVTYSIGYLPTAGSF